MRKRTMKRTTLSHVSLGEQGHGGESDHLTRESIGASRYEKLTLSTNLIYSISRI